MSSCWHWCFYEPLDIFFSNHTSIHVFYHLMTCPFYYCRSTFNHSANKNGRLWWKGRGDEREEEDGRVSGWPAGDPQLGVSCVTSLICCHSCVYVCVMSRVSVLVWLNITFYQQLKVHRHCGPFVWEFVCMYACFYLCLPVCACVIGVLKIQNLQ